MKRFLLIFLLSLTTAALAQAPNNTERPKHKHDIALGADIDSLQYIVASPFDNWYLGVGGGVQTFIGNELFASARRNKIDYQFYLEIGKWIIPDVSVSFHAKVFSVHGQSEYGRQPFIDRTSTDPGDNGYWSFSAHGLTFGGLVTMDWTKLFHGFERGLRRKVHVMTPIGLGASMFFGKQVNPRRDIGGEIGDFRKNFELYYTGGFLVQYKVSPHIAIDGTLALLGSESTWDWSPYDNSYGRFDIMPMLTIGARFNLFKQIYKKNVYNDEVYLDKINHEFLTYGTRHTVSDLNSHIENINAKIDSLVIDIALKGADNQNDIDSLNLELDRLQNELAEAQKNAGPANPLQEIAEANELLNLPAAIVYFELDKYDIDYNAHKRLEYFAKQVKANLDDTTVFYLIGAADTATGTPKHNQWLSEHRCQAVYDVLIKEYGFDSKRFVVKPLGGIMEYEPKEYNRVSMIILRTKETTDILNKWEEKYNK